MFRNRRSSQKPDEDFIANFRQSFPEVGPSSTRPDAGASTQVAVDMSSDAHSERQHSLSHEDMKDLDPTPKGQNESWRFTPSLLDPTSFAFSAFANQPPAYYTPTPGSANPLYHNQAGDLHTPGMSMSMSLSMSMGLGTPLSMPTSAHGLQGGPMLDMSAYSQQMPAAFTNYNPFGQQHHLQEMQHQQTSYAPSSFVHQDTGYETMEHDGSPSDDQTRPAHGDDQMHSSPLVNFRQPQYDMSLAGTGNASDEKFRFRVTLSAPTAMVKHVDEIPITYLNKGQAYSVSIIDTAPMHAVPGSRYRTYIRISFEDEEQRLRPATCWQLWKEGRGMNEAHQRGGKLQAVEYVEASQPAENEERRTRVELETASFDGFSVLWTPGLNTTPDCNIAVRFNFLSTDFSHSKGVKGIPVRFCAKTEIVSGNVSQTATERAEVAYCKVKLFRDHGAERKLTNDVAHVKKTIDKLKQQITQAESGMRDFGKRKRTTSISTKAQEERPGKVHKHKRTWSISSTSSAGGRAPAEEDLHFKLHTMQDMFTSTRPVSILSLRGSEHDDPDLHPVTLTGEPLDLIKSDSAGNLWHQRSGGETRHSSLVSPTPSSMSTQSHSAVTSARGHPPRWSDLNQVNSGDIEQGKLPDQLTKIPKLDAHGKMDGWIEALGVDSSYEPPVTEHIKPVACFYILMQNLSGSESTQYHRAIYLTQRSLKDFNEAVAVKWNLDATHLRHTVHVIDSGLQVKLDDDVVRELAEGQAIKAEVVPVQPRATFHQREWDLDADPTSESELNDIPAHESGSYDLHLRF